MGLSIPDPSAAYVNRGLSLLPGGGGGGGTTWTSNNPQVWQDRVALNNALSGTGAGVNVNRATSMLTKRGLGPGDGNYLNALMRMSLRGGVGGKKAKFLEQALSLKNVDTWGQSATVSGTDQIDRAYQTMMENLGGALGPGADTGSPAVLDTVRRYIEGRSADTTRFNTSIAGQVAEKKNAIMLNQLAPTLDETGSLVESLRMLDQEQSALRRAQYTQLGMQGAGLGLAAFA